MKASARIGRCQWRGFKPGSRFAAPLAAMAGSNSLASARLRTATSVACSAEHATLEPA
ncbi:hypothetical protein [Ensifer sp. YR511]|uniref:hypothetical protein n=1 Tax=Ensifer sp. YR511 TaxID=1855294 RepID=UPI00159F91E9|nr:hypothetical protein [Ensifer sp. YR511]